jgi:Family of unknown function (DUF5996)
MGQANFTDMPQSWPALPLAAWKDTCDTIHMWMQIVGKVRLALSPLTNHWWEVPLYVGPRGLTTSAIPFSRGIFEVCFDFLAHQLVISTSENTTKSMALQPRSVADFYHEFVAMLHALGIDVKIWTTPVEVPSPIPFEQDVQHASYDPEYANRFWRVLIAVDTVFKEFRSRFIGKNSPVHFFWGSFDLAVTRFSGRRAPRRENADSITQEAYSHEVISAGWWPGGGSIQDAAFYAYAAPEPRGFDRSSVRPLKAFYDPEQHEFFLMYEDVRQSPSPGTTLMEFLETTYEAGANLGNWNRSELERLQASR